VTSYSYYHKYVRVKFVFRNLSFFGSLVEPYSDCYAHFIILLNCTVRVSSICWSLIRK